MGRGRLRPPGRARGGAAAAPVSPPGEPLAAVVAALPGVRAGALPRTPRVQLATLVAAAPEGPEWLHEVKFDGYRIVARLADGAARLLSRNGRDWTVRFPAVAAAVARLPARQALLDGEVAVLLPDGTTSFQALQNVMAGEPGHRLIYYVFDLLHLDGLDLTAAPLEGRKDVLRRLLAAAPDPLRFSDHVVGAGPEVFAQACRLGLEGIVSKRRDAPYEATRTRAWLKVKCLHEQEVVIGGFSEPAGTRTALGALLVGVHDADGALRYAGKVGTGFSEATLRSLHRRLAALEQPRSPFADRVPGAGRVHWVRPELVAEVSFTEWTGDGKLRHPSFKGLREDKPAREVVRERPARAPAATGDRSAATPARADRAPVPARTIAARPAPGANPGPDPAGQTRPRRAPPAPRERAGRRPPGALPGTDERRAPVTVAGVRLTHPDRVLYPAQGTTKRDLARFYESIADWVLPHLRGRPLTLVRCPEGTGGECFYMKHSGVWAPPALRRIRIQERTKIGEYLVVDDLAGLVSLVQMGILEIHTWNSTAEHLEQPDRIVFDLDPGPAVPWPRVIETARLVRATLRGIGLESFVKTTGGKGLHVVVPLRPAAGWDACFQFSRAISEVVVRQDPRGLTTEMRKAGRADKILIDYLRNRRGNTSIAAYSTRARPGAPVSTPLAWEELDADLRSDRFTIANMGRRLARLRADPWARYWDLPQSLPGHARAGPPAAPPADSRSPRRRRPPAGAAAAASRPGARTRSREGRDVARRRRR